MTYMTGWPTNPIWPRERMSVTEHQLPTACVVLPMSPSDDHGPDPMDLEIRHFSLPGTSHTLEDSIFQKDHLDTKEDVTWHRAVPHLEKQS